MNTEKLALWPGGPEIRQTAQAPVGTDAVLLADFAAGKGKRGIDLGCGSGILSLLLLLGSEALRMTGLELNAAAAALARENLERCGLSLRGEIRQGDIRRVRELFQTGSFDLAVSNPPYFPKGSGRSAPDPQRASAREEADCSLDELCAAAAYLLPTGGRLCVVYRNLMKLSYDNTRTRCLARIDAAENAERKTPLELFAEFYEKQNGAALGGEQESFLKTLIETIWEEEA